MTGIKKAKLLTAKKEKAAFDEFEFGDDHSISALFKATKNNLTMTARLLNVNKASIFDCIYGDKKCVITIDRANRSLTMFSDISRWESSK